jgi:hypothetical protein
MKKTLAFIIFGLSIIISSCCLTIKEKHLGNNLYLSEYDNVDRRIFYSKEKCSGGGIEIVPMTVIEYAFDAKWIIAKTGTGNGSKNQYWIIKKIEKEDPTVEDIKSNTLGQLDLEEFKKKLIENRIDLTLEKIK